MSKPHSSHDFSETNHRCLRCQEHVLSLDAKLPCRPRAVTPLEPLAVTGGTTPLWDADDPDVWVEF